MPKLNALFDLSKLEKRKTADQKEFEELHQGDCPIFYDIMHTAFEMTKKESRNKAPHFMDKNYYAVVMSGNIQGLLREKFPFEIKDGPNDRIMFSRKGKFCLFFKKLDNRMMPSNVRTEYVQLVAYQRTIEGGDKMPIIFVGYTVAEDWSELTGVYAVYINNNKPEWVTVITGEADSSKLLSGIPIEPVAPLQTRVRRKAQ